MREGPKNSLPIGLALVRGIASAAAKLWDGVRVRNVIVFDVPPTLSYECEGRFCEQLMWEVHEGLEEAGYIAVLDMRGNRYTFHLFRKISL